MHHARPTKTGWEEIAPQVQRFVHTWEAAGKAQAAMCIVHGLGEHGGRYHSLATDLVASGVHVVAFDQQGHGQNPGRRAQIASYPSLLNDIHLMLAWLKSQHPQLPIILFGHSMGGNLVLNYALRRKQREEMFRPQGVISSSPMIRAVRAPAGWMESALRLLTRITPNYQLKSFIIPERLMSDPVEQQALVDDQLFHNRLTLRLGAGLLDSGRWLLQHAHELDIPCLLTHGSDDYLTSPFASQEFAERAGENCQFELLHGHLHDPFRDLGREQVLECFIDFVRRQAPTTEATSGELA